MPLANEAFSEWSAHQAGRKNMHRVAEEHGSPAGLIDEIVREVRSRSLSFRPIHRYSHIEPTNGKVREIGVESVKQQVCDYIAVLALTPVLDAKIGYWQVASVKGKGELMLVDACARWSRRYTYHVHTDVRKCYPSIRHDVVMRILEKYVRSEDVLYLCRTLLSTYGGGLEIGSYFSLKMAQLVLSFGYHHVEGLHKERRGKLRKLVGAQAWYADDCFMFGDDKRDLRAAVRSLESYMGRELGVELKGWKICACGDDEPVPALSYSVSRSKVTVKSGTYLRARRAFREFEREPTLRRARRVVSYWGFIKHSDCARASSRHGYGSTHSHARSMVSAHDRAKRIERGSVGFSYHEVLDPAARGAR